MGSISVKLHREFSTRASRRTLGRFGNPSREMRLSLRNRERKGLSAKASAGVNRALRILFELLLWIGCFVAGALAFAYLSSRW